MTEATDRAARVRKLSRIELNRLIPQLDLRGATYSVAGGWAVFVYNDYQESEDIDIIYQHGIDLEDILETRLGWTPPGPHDFPGRYSKQFNSETVILDMLTSKDKNNFHEKTKRSLPFALALEERYSVVRSIGDMKVRVPKKELLLAYKIKAARDRKEDLRNPKLSTSVSRYLEGKIDKDLRDIIALVDPAYELIDREAFYKMVKPRHIDFIIATLRELAANPPDYRNASRREIQSWLQILLNPNE